MPAGNLKCSPQPLKNLLEQPTQWQKHHFKSGGAENNWGIIKKLLRKSKLCVLKMQKIYEPNKSNWIVTKIKNKKVHKNDNESGVPAENIRIIVC